jgi:hypothetical protein
MILVYMNHEQNKLTDSDTFSVSERALWEFAKLLMPASLDGFSDYKTWYVLLAASYDLVTVVALVRCLEIFSQLSTLHGLGVAAAIEIARLGGAKILSSTVNSSLNE